MGLSGSNLNKYFSFFTFKYIKDKDRIWECQPWTIKGAHFVLKLWDLNLALEEIDFMWSTFWVQVYGLSLKFMNKHNAKKVGSLIGRVNQVQEDVG